ncbi:patatin [Labilibacter sediminis]|nr:patatin [Labilibacter sediminis]
MPKSPYLFSIAFLFVFSSLFAQQSEETYRPKVGLVLSGGGAKGMAHVGVLKVLEELNIRPDYITGTSMGSIMGGLYAIGYTADQLDSIINVIDWNAMLSDKIPLTLVVPEEKHAYSRFLFQFDLTRKGPVLPAGVVAGQGIAEEMNHLTWHTAEYDNFDDFPIPFRCVASDLISGEPHVFKSGNLATAMRASMAIPSVFSPVVIDSMLLVDGGVLDNMPVLTCKEMGADIIITINVGFREKPSIDDFKSIGDVLMGAAMIRSNYNIDESLAHTDILISPDLLDYGAASFFNGREIIDLGEDAARERFDELEDLANFLSQFDNQQDAPEIQLLDEIYIEDIRVEGLQHVSDKFILGKFGLEKGNNYNKQDINGGLHKLMGTRYISNVSYHLELGQHGYILTLQPIETFRSKYNFSIHYNNTYKASAIFNLTLRNYVFKGSHLGLTFDLSEYPRINTEFIDYIGARQLAGTFFKAQWEANQVTYFNEDGSRLGSFNQNYTNTEVGILFTPDTKRILRGSVFYQRQISNSGNGLLDLIIKDVDRIGNEWWGFKLNYNMNSLNEQFFATRGSQFDLNMEYPIGFNTIYSGSEEAIDNLDDLVDIPVENYLKFKASFNQYIPLSSRFNIAYLASIGGATEDLGSMQYFNFGGLRSIARTKDIPFVGLSPREVTAQQFLMGRVDLRYEPINSLYISLIGNVLDYKSDFDDLSFTPNNTLSTDDVVIGGGVMLSYYSILGPLELGYSRCTLHNKNRWYFTAGFPF